MKDLAIALAPRPGALADVGEALARAGGGAWHSSDGAATAHFLFADGAAARRALEQAGIAVLAERDVLVQRLDQETPGQLGSIARRLAEADVNIEVMYSDHAQQLILVVDDFARGQAVSEQWTRERSGR